MNKLASITAATAILSPSIAFGAPADNELDVLWREREAIIRIRHKLYEELDAAYRDLPAWASSGPSRLNSEGKKVGPNCGWPEVATLPSPPNIPNAYRIIRFSPDDLKADFENYVSLFPDGSREAKAIRAKARQRYRDRMRAFIVRRREQQEVERGLRIPELTDRNDRHYDEYWAINDKIGELPPSINQAAALAMIEACFELTGQATVNEPDNELRALLKQLRALKPCLTGAVCNTVNRLFENPDATMESLGIIAS